MNNEETIITQPKSDQHGNQQQPIQQEGKKTNIRKTVTTAAAAAIGGATLGAAATAAVMHDDIKAEEANAQMPEHQDEVPTVEAQPEEQANPTETAAQAETSSSSPEPTHVASHQVNAQPIDYTNHDGTDPVVTVDEPQLEAQASPVVDNAEPEVQVLGIYEHYTDEGIHQTAAVVTDGTEVAAVVDTTGDGYADTFAQDFNHNGQFDEGEACNISDQGIPMSAFNETYVAQQQMEQQMDDMTQAQTASCDGMPDYNNDVNIEA